jgi:hypothetical protein
VSEAYRAPSRIVLSARYTNLPLPERTTVDAGVPRFRWPSQKHLTPTRCGNCKARLLRSVAPTAEEPLVDVCCLYCSRVACELIADAMPRPMTAATFRALPITQPKRQKPRHPCADCGAQILRENVRCANCNAEHRAGKALATRIVMVLSKGVAMTAGELADTLGTDPGTLRDAISKARDGGRPIVRVGGKYRLGAPS